MATWAECNQQIAGLDSGPSLKGGARKHLCPRRLLMRMMIISHPLACLCPGIKEWELGENLGFKCAGGRCLAPAGGTACLAPHCTQSDGHHWAGHAALGFFSSPFRTAIVASVDGEGSDGAFNVYAADRSAGLSLLQSIPMSLGYLRPHRLAPTVAPRPSPVLPSPLPFPILHLGLACPPNL